MDHQRPLSPGRFRQLVALYESAAALPRSEQRDWIAAACGDDQALATELLALLAAGERPEARLIDCARVQLRAAAADLIRPPPAPATPTNPDSGDSLVD